MNVIARTCCSWWVAVVPLACVLTGFMGCTPPVTPTGTGDGPVAEGVLGAQGDPIPNASAEQLATFERGKAVLKKRFDLADGLGPTFNLVSCIGCHEKPAGGGTAGLYRNFFLGGSITGDGAFLFSESNGNAGGVLRLFNYDESLPARPVVPDTTTIFAQRKSIPMFGVGLMVQIPDEEILSRSDPDDADGDGISGRPNYDRGFVGRLGRKCQTVSVEGFIRGPLFNHLGLTTDPLSDAQRSQLPVDSATLSVLKTVETRVSDTKLGPHMQAAAPDAPNTDDDGVADPEFSSQDLFDLVSFAMLLAGPKPEPLSETANQGRLLFHEAKCSSCHVPRVDSPAGPLPLYSDLLLHDMGEELADGIVMKEATGSEFRTQPLWGIASVGPYLHDGRADTLDEAILAHGGEGQASRDAFEAFSTTQRAQVIEFLTSLGGREQMSTGLLPPDAAVPAAGAYGGPRELLDEQGMTRFVTGRELYDHEFGHDAGVGALTGADSGPRFNGDSCRACHFDPVIGGAGPRDVNVMRCGHVEANGDFTAPTTTPNTILHKEIRNAFAIPMATSEINVFEHRQTPHTFGLGLIDAISDETIRSHEDPDDTDGDGISGRAHVLPDGRVGRLGWKAQVPNVGEFVRDAMAAEIGLTVAAQPGLTFGITTDGDAVSDPELTVTEAEDLAFFISNLAPPPRQAGATSAEAMRGEEVFDRVGCAKCHMPSLPSTLGDVPLYSDLLLHEILPAGMPGIVDGDAGQREFRTAPLWGLSQTAPYFHTGEADTIEEAIQLHDGEAATIRDAFNALSAGDKADLLAFLGTL